MEKPFEENKGHVCGKQDPLWWTLGSHWSGPCGLCLLPSTALDHLSILPSQDWGRREEAGGLPAGVMEKEPGKSAWRESGRCLD